MRLRSAVVPLQNRVTPGDLVATADRGLAYGIRSCLHDELGRIRPAPWAGAGSPVVLVTAPTLVEVLRTGRRGDVPFRRPSAQT